jgi:hypothetical protein
MDLKISIETLQSYNLSHLKCLNFPIEQDILAKEESDSFKTRKCLKFEITDDSSLFNHIQQSKVLNLPASSESNNPMALC